MDGQTPEREDESALDELQRRLRDAAEPALAQGLLASVRHLHDLLREVRPSSDGFRAVIEFLTEVGHHADARRQEWVLLADVLGISTMVEDLNGTDDGATPGTLIGPFYRDDVPDMPLGADISRDGIGERLTVRGRVVGTDGSGVAGARVEVWQANGDGRYENQEPDRQPEFNLRGAFRADLEGRFFYKSVKPKGYPLPEDGPVGRLLNRLGYRLERPAHLHFRVTAPGFRALTTQIFDREDPAIGRDALFGVKPDLLAEFRRSGTAERSPAWSTDVTLTLARVAGGAERQDGGGA